MSNGMISTRQEIEAQSAGVIRALRDHITVGERLAVVKAPPGSGKTYTLIEAAAFAVECGYRVAVAAQTNAQADDICRRAILAHPEDDIWRFSASGYTPPEALATFVRHTTSEAELPQYPSLSVGTAAKWSLVKLRTPFDILFVDEAWQLSWVDFMLLGQVAPRYILIGDPGQIPPVITIGVQRWETSPRAPHRPAPDVILGYPQIAARSLGLPVCRRLPWDSVDLVRPFYDFPFAAWAQPCDRFLRPMSQSDGRGVDLALGLLEDASAAILTAPTPSEGPPLERDEDVARLAADVALRALELRCVVASEDDGEPRPIRPDDIGIMATHRAMNSAILRCLPANLRNQTSAIRVDTPERWQGLERPLMVAVHPLSGVLRPSSFDLETGRLCVMAPRHRAGLVIVTRDHVPETLDGYMPSADQAPGRPDITGRGHAQHFDMWTRMAARGLVVGTA